MFFRIVGYSATLFAHIQFASSLLELVGELLIMYLLTVRLQRTSLCKRLVTLVALVRTDTCRHMTRYDNSHELSRNGEEMNRSFHT